MKKLILGLVSFLFIFTFVVVAANPKSPADYNGLNKGNSDVNHLYLYEKDNDWNIVSNGAWGKMTYDEESFVFNGHGLMPGVTYELINYIDLWPGTGSNSLGTATADIYGDVHISGLTVGASGTKVWLVLSNDFTTQMVGWHPSDYLFEYDLLP